MNAVRLRNRVTGAESLHATDGVFIFIGHDPNNAVFGDQIALNENGYIITDQRYRTNVDGVFAAGEIQDEIWRQVATSVGSRHIGGHGSHPVAGGAGRRVAAAGFAARLDSLALYLRKAK